MDALYGAGLRCDKWAAGIVRAARGGKDDGSPISETKRDYEVGRGKPPVHSRFKKGQSGNPRGPRPKNLPALLVDALNEKVVVTIDGERREVTKREAVIAQLVNKSASAELRATKMLIDMLRDIEKRADPAPAEKNPFSPTDKEVVQQLIARLRRNMCNGCTWAAQQGGLDSRPHGRDTENTGQTRLAE